MFDICVPLIFCGYIKIFVSVRVRTGELYANYVNGSVVSQTENNINLGLLIVYIHKHYFWKRAKIKFPYAQANILQGKCSTEFIMVIQLPL